MKIDISTNNIKITDDLGQEFNYALSQLVGQAYVRKNSVDTLILSFSLGPHSYHEIPLITALLLNGVAFVSVATFKLLLSASIASNTSAGSGGISVEAEYKSPTDFTTQRRPTASQIDLLNLNVPITTSSQLKFVTVTNLGTKLTKQYVNGSEQISLYFDPANNRVTINKDGVALNAFPQGSGALITITQSGGALTGIGVATSSATNYAVGDIFSVVQAGGSLGQGIVTSVDSIGNPTGYGVYVAGSGYTTGVGTAPVTASAITTYGIDAFVVVGVDGQRKGYDPTSNSDNDFVINYPVQPIDGELLNVALTGTFAGTNCTINTTVSTAGAIKIVTIAVAGTGYLGGASGTAYLRLVGGNSDAILSVTVTSGVCSLPLIITAGSGYTASATNATTEVAVSFYPSSDGIDLGYYKNIAFAYRTNLSAGAIYTSIEVCNEDTPTAWFNATKVGYISSGSQAGASGLIHIGGENGTIDFDDILIKKVRLKTVIDVNTSGAIYYSYIMKGI